MKRVWEDDQLAALLPQSISGDAQMRDAAEALAPFLRKLALSVPNLLIFGRMGNQQPEEMIPSLGNLTAARLGLQKPSSALLEQLAWQFHVDFREVARTDEQLAAMVLNSIPWHRIKGTPASLKDAFSIFGLSDIYIEEDGAGKHWATYQLGLPALIADLDAARLAYRIAFEMQPARCRLWRIYSTLFDRRPIVLSEGPILGDGWLSFYSGVPVDNGLVDDDAGDVIVSFGKRTAVQADPYADENFFGSFGISLDLGFVAPYLDRFIVGRSRLSDVFPRNHSFVIGSLYSILWADRATSGRTWRGEWDARAWSDIIGFDRKLPLWRMEGRQLSKSQLVPGWGEVLSDNNARLGATFAVVIDNPGKLGDMVLSEHDTGRRELRLHEMFCEGNATSTPPLEPEGTSYLGIRSLQAVSWSGTWADGDAAWDSAYEIGYQ
jgi:hypothetical protein